MPFGDYLEGLVFFAVVWGSAAGSGLLVRRRLLGHLRGAPAVAAIGVSGYAALLLAHLVPGALEILTRWSVAAASLALMLALLWLLPRRDRVREEPLPDPRSGRASWVLAGVAAGLAAAVMLGVLGSLANVPVGGFDWNGFQLPTVIRWLQAESLWEYPVFLPRYPTGTYPNTADVVVLGGILPWSDPALARAIAAPVLGLTAVAVYGTARELRAPRPTAILIAALLLSVPSVWSPQLEEIKPDGFMLAMFACAVLFLVRHVRTGAVSDLALAGVGLGLAFGSRWYGLSSAVVVIVARAAVQLFARRGALRVAREGALLGGLTLLVGGFWLVRNAVTTGNPLYPVKVELFGLTIFDAPRDLLLDRAGYTIADYVTDGGALGDAIWPALRETAGLPALMLALGALAAVIAAVRVLQRRAEAGRGAVAALALALCAGGVACAWAITPGSAQGPEGAPVLGLVASNTRWLMPALVAAAGAAAWGVGRLDGRARVGAEAVVLVGVLAGVSQSEAPARWLAAGALAVVVVGGAAWVASRPAARRRLGRPAVAAGLAVVAALALAAVGYRQQQRFNEVSFAGSDRAVEAVRRAPPGTRVAMAGTSLGAYAPVAPLFGEQLENDVSWLGPIRRSQLLNHPDEASFRAALRRRAPELLVVFRGRPAIWRLGLPGEPDAQRIVASVPAERWARAEGYRLVTRGPNSTLLAR